MIEARELAATGQTKYPQSTVTKTANDARVKTKEPTGFPGPGDVFEGRYRIEALIGSGGFARVYRATQLDLGREVALKIMLPEEMLKNVLPDSSSEQGHKLAERFMQEARVVAKLRDPHTVTMHDHGRSEEGLLFMVFEFIDGVSLSRLVKAQGAVDPRRVAKILRQSLSSLQEAHAMGMLHRDIKPANIMIYEHVGRPDQIKVLDFGIAKVVGRKVSQDLSDDLTTNGALLGTPRYMSPEQIRGDELDPSTDLYSLGLVAYEMLTGKKAIDSNSSVIIIGAQLDPRPFAVPNQPHIPPKLRQIVNRMLFKQRQMRYQTVDEVLADLGGLDTNQFTAVQLPTRTRQVTDRTGEMEVPDISDSIEPLKVQEAESNRKRSEGKRKLLVLAAAVFVLASITGIGGAMLLNSTRGDDASESTPSVDDAEEPGEAVPVVVDREETTPEQPTRDEPAEVAAAPTPAEIVISTTPPKLRIFVNDRRVGTSPVTVQSSEVDYPATIRADLDGQHSRTTVLDSAADVEIDLSMFAEAAAEKTDDRPKTRRGSRKGGGSKKSSGKGGSKKIAKKDDSRQDDKNDSSDDSSGDGDLKLPALDY